MMTNAVASLLLVISLSGEGHWFAERPGTIRIDWAVPEQAVDAILTWRLAVGDVQLTDGRRNLTADGKAVVVTIEPPAVRSRTRLRWLYTLHDDEGRELARGEQVLHVYPDNQLAGLAARLSDPVAVIAEEDAPLLTVFAGAGVPHRRVERASALQLQPPRFVLVAAGQLTQTGRDSEALVQLAKAGASVMIFEQAQIDRLMGLRLHRRPAPAALTWRDCHALFRGFDAIDRASWLRDDRDVWAITLPVDQPGLELAHWPVEVEPVEPSDAAPVEALVLTRTVGRGRIVLWQIPLGPWEDDPRSQRLLVNALDYLGTQPGPTPALVDRLARPDGKAGE